MFFAGITKANYLQQRLVLLLMNAGMPANAVKVGGIKKKKTMSADASENVSQGLGGGIKLQEAFVSGLREATHSLRPSCAKPQTHACDQMAATCAPRALLHHPQVSLLMTYGLRGPEYSTSGYTRSMLLKASPPRCSC